MGKYDDILAGLPAEPAATSSPAHGKYDDILAGLPTEAPPESKLKRALSDYGIHPAIEGGAMLIGGGAGAVMGAPAGPMGSAAGGLAGSIAMYPPAHEAANKVDEMIGLKQEAPKSLAKNLEDGATIEAGGRVLGATGKAIAQAPFAKFAEGFTGSPASNFSRTFDKGLSMYSAPSVEDASAKFGSERFKLLGQTLTPEEQVGMLTNPNGEATKKVADVMTRWIKGEPINSKDALMARQAVDSVFPNNTAKKATQRGGLSDFRSAMNDILSEQSPDMKAASDQYANAKLKSQMTQPFRVNKTNPNEPSKLGLMLGAGEAGRALTTGHFGEAIGYFATQSPAFMGFVSALSGTLAKTLPHLSPDAQVGLARGLFASFQAQRSSGGFGKGATQ